jgi:glucosamine kinase
MILIADSGSTKTDWRLISENGIKQIQSKGLNPVYKSKDKIKQVILDSIIPEIGNVKNINAIYFYGAGCMGYEKAEIVKCLLLDLFPNAKNIVSSDILAAARATCENNEGITAILGTGANVCYYNGEEIVKTRSGLGFVLGDEGSGAHLGKMFIKAYLNEELPIAINERFEKRFKLTKADIIDAVYRHDNPNLFLAQFSKYVFQIKDEPAVTKIIIDCFTAFFKVHVERFDNYKTLPLHIVGSVGFYYSNFIRRIAAEKGIKIGTILEKPIAGLTLFHEKEI